MPPPIQWFELATGFEISDRLSIGSSLFQIGFQQNELLLHSFHRGGSSLHEEILSICLFVRHHFLFTMIFRAFPSLFFFSLTDIQLSGLV